MGQKSFKLLNILTEELLELNIESPYINDVIDLLFENSYNKEDELTDDAFIKKCLNLIATK